MTHPEKIVDALKAMPKEQQEFVINSMLERIPFPLKTMFAEKLKQKLNAL